MEKTIKIEGLENRRYSISTNNYLESYNIIISIQTRQEFVWQNIYAELFMLVDEESLEKYITYTKDEYVLIQNNITVNERHRQNLKTFKITELFESIEKNFDITKKIVSNDLEFINQIEEELKGIYTIEYKED